MEINNYVRSKPPCKGCVKRNPGCHGKCDKYAEWKCKLDKLNDEIKKYKKEMDVFPRIT